MIGPPLWMDHLAAWVIYVCGLLVLLALAAVIARLTAYWAVLALQWWSRAIGIYADFWHWYRRHRLKGSAHPCCPAAAETPQEPPA